MAAMSRRPSSPRLMIVRLASAWGSATGAGPAAILLVAALFWFAWGRYDGVVLSLGLLFIANAASSFQFPKGHGSSTIRPIGSKRSLWHVMPLCAFLAIVLLFVALRIAELMSGSPAPRAATPFEQWGALLLTLPLPLTIVVDGFFRRSPRRVTAGLMGVIAACLAFGSGLAWRDGVAFTFFVLSISTVCRR